MDLRAMLNGPDGGASKKQPPQPSLQPPSVPATTPTLAAAPSTPSHGIPPQSFRDYSHSSHASPLPTHEYPPSHQSHPNHAPASAGPGPYPSPTSYNPPANAFTGRPPVPPLQPPNPHDIRSPGSASISGPSPGYRRTPTSSISTTSGGYPFPAQQPPVSPVQRHQYGPQSAGPGAGPGISPSLGPYPRDSYNQSQQHSSVQYAHGQQPPQTQLPQTPPVLTPGGSHQYLHQRSHSIQSTPTPTSAHSQSVSYGAPYIQGSPVATHHPPPPLEQQQHQLQHQHHQRQSSQPPTPLGQPMPGPLRQSPAASYPQPSSPYQKRISTAPAGPYSTQPQLVQSSPPPLPPSSIQRMSTSSSRGTYDAVAESHRGSASRSDRERSISVSPKTRVPSLPSNGGSHRPLSANSDSTPYNAQRLPPAPTNNNTMEPQNAAISTKRKLEQRDLGSDDLENDRKRPPPPQMNGNHATSAAPGMVAQASGPVAVPRRKRVKYDHIPVWAQSTKTRPPVKTRNFSLKHHIRQHGNSGSLANGSNQHDTTGSIKIEHTSRHPSPEVIRSAGVKMEEPNNTNTKGSLVFNGQPFPWEPSISNETPMNIVSREVADFLAYNVLQFEGSSELQKIGAQFEIEAKLGSIIDKMTNQRIYFPGVKAGECVLEEGGRVAFRSSMTEGQHQKLNGYLNEQVKASFPQNPRAQSRVQVQYVHRREIDRFYELPPPMRQRMPPSILNLPNQSTNAPLKARVSYDQKTGKVLAKIVKARVANMNIHFPHLPLDCRISVNIEWDWDGPVEEIEGNQIPNKERPPDRIKDRLSYTHGFYQIDLTQVTQGQPTSGGQPPQPHPATPKEHELEVELEARSLIEHGRMLMQQQPNRYEDLVDGLVNNMRLLARRCLPN